MQKNGLEISFNKTVYLATTGGNVRNTDMANGHKLNEQKNVNTLCLPKQSTRQQTTTNKDVYTQLSSVLRDGSNTRHTETVSFRPSHKRTV